MTHLERLLREEQRYRQPMHPSDFRHLLAGVYCWDHDHPNQHHTYRMLEDELYGNIPHSSFFALLKELRTQGDFSPYKTLAGRAGFDYFVPKKKKLIYVRKVSEAERWTPDPDPEDAYLPDSDVDAAGMVHYR